MTERLSTNGSSETILILNDIQKTFGGIHALSGVSFDLKRGEVHALCGENGAGKSTLIKTITGAYIPDGGTIQIGDVSYEVLTPEQARNLGVGVVYQEFNLLPDMPVDENIFLTNPPMGRVGLIDTKARANQAYQLLERLGAHKHINPNELVKNLTVGEQQIVEIAKALATNAHILIMDEPSAVLPSRDVERLYTVVQALREEGVGVIYISHRLNEIFDLADRVTVLKDGQSMGTLKVAETNNDELVRLMVGRELTDMYPPADVEIGDVLLEVHNLCIEGMVFDVSFSVREGEIVGLAGLGGSGRTTIARAMVGLAKIDSGEIRYFGQKARMNPASAARAGVVLIPEDRKAYGLILDQSTRFNITLPNLPQLERWRIILKRNEWDPVLSAIEEVQLRPPNPEMPSGNLSGGNQQKVVIAKWLMARPKVIVFDEPTRGIDVGAKAEIYTRIREISRQGVGVIMASSDLPELLGMSDRILVMHEGRLAGEVPRDEASEEAIMLLATATETEAETVVPN
ncbi:MAG: sugar ABC transporter ATP-binding protein [Candidatus Promineifilaceae bacterium]|nr:sugar ABC transporter ATP-binding protein [Candidatus Promineifilaceae bacterium]